MAYLLLAHTSAGTPSGTNVTTPGIDTTGADLLVAAVATYGAGSITVSDSKGNTWTPLTQRGGGGNRVQLYWCDPSSVGSGHTFTATSGANPALGVLALSGKAASPFDAESGAAADSPGSITPAEDNELLVTAISYYPSQTPTVDGGFNLRERVDYNGTTMGLDLAYLIQTSAAAANPAWGGSFPEHASALAAFKAAAGGGGGGTFGSLFWWDLYGRPLGV